MRGLSDNLPLSGASSIPQGRHCTLYSIEGSGDEVRGPHVADASSLMTYRIIIDYFCTDMGAFTYAIKIERQEMLRVGGISNVPLYSEDNVKERLESFDRNNCLLFEQSVFGEKNLQ